MSNEEFRRELKNVFDDVSGSPSSNLPDRVRDAVANPPEAGGPYWLAAVAAVVIAVLVVSVLYVAGPLKPPSTVGGVNPTPIPTPTAGATPSASPAPTPEFVCAGQSYHYGGTSPQVAFVSALRTGSHAGYDRVTIEFANGTPADVTFSVQSGTAFVLSPSGLPTTLKGHNGILIVIHGADLHTSYSGSTDLVTGYKGLAEVKRIEDFEGTVQIGLGVNGQACYRLTVLSSPARLVIDVPAS